MREDHPGLPVIVMTAHSDLDTAVASYQGGAFEYLPKPFDVDEAGSEGTRPATAEAERLAKPFGGEDDHVRPDRLVSPSLVALPLRRPLALTRSW